MRDKLGVFFSDEQFAGVFSTRGQPGYSPWRLALVLVMQYVEDLSDRQAANAVRGRIDWKYALGLELEDAGFDHSLLSEFRQRLLAGGQEQELLDTMLQTLVAAGLVKQGGKQRTDSTHVIAAVGELNRLETIGETLRAALNELAVLAPEWLQTVVSAEWYMRYGKGIQESRLPRSAKEKQAWVQQVGQDGQYLLSQLYQTDKELGLWETAGVQALRLVWLHQFYQDEEGIKLREPSDLPPATIRFNSPYDVAAHYSRKGETKWVGYKVHLSESCDEQRPHLITHVETTPGFISDRGMVDLIHDQLADKACLPGVHFLDGGYTDARQLTVTSQTQPVRLVTPVQQDSSWQALANDGYALADFQIDYQAQRVTCPQGKNSIYWQQKEDRSHQPLIRAAFSARDCLSCSVRDSCTRQKRRSLTLHLEEQHHFLTQARQEQQTQTWQTAYAKRAGIEGTISAGVRSFGLRHSRYLGLAKTHLQHVLTAAAINIVRLDAWWLGQKRAVTRTSRFAALQPSPA
jgi:transposase